MDFIPFNTSGNEQQKSSPYVLKQNRTLPNGSTPNSRNKNNSKPSLGSSASFPSFGSPAIGFGSPALQNASFSPLNRQTSPRPYQNASLNRQPSPYQSTPRSYSPRHSQNSYQFTPPSFTSRQNNNGQSFNDNSNFKAPHQSFSPRGRGNGRKSFTRQFNQVMCFNNVSGFWNKIHSV